LILDIKRITHLKFTAEEKTRILLEGFQRDTPIRDLCRRECIRSSTYCVWLKDFMGAGKESLTSDITRNATRLEIQEIKQENARLKQLLAGLKTG
jgi:transposase